MRTLSELRADLSRVRMALAKRPSSARLARREASLVDELRARLSREGRALTTLQVVARLLQDGLRFMVGGSTALRFYSPSRAEPSDLDLLIEPSADAGRKIITALEVVGAPSVLALPDSFAAPDVRVADRSALVLDLMTPPASVDFEEHFAMSRKGRFEGMAVQVAAPATLRALLSVAMEHEPARRETLARELRVLEGVA